MSIDKVDREIVRRAAEDLRELQDENQRTENDE